MFSTSLKTVKDYSIKVIKQLPKKRVVRFLVK